VDTNNHIASNEEFNHAASRHFRATTALCLAFIAYYFALLIGAAYFRVDFTAQVSGRVNVGLLFAISQYFVAGLVAWIYTRIMRETDRAMETFKQ
jgi:uncharacterized membrane protein (DUF485 family)